ITNLHLHSFPTRRSSDLSTANVRFETIRPVYTTDPAKCPLNYVVADTDSWEQKVAHALEDMDEVVSYVKNDTHIAFVIPYTFERSEEHTSELQSPCNLVC